MEKYDYKSAVYEDIVSYMEDNKDWVRSISRDDLREELTDTLWTVDSVTGNGSGSYTFSTWEAEENLCHNLDLLKEVMDEGFCSINILDSPEGCDVAIRCYLLGECLEDYLNSEDFEELYGETEEEQ